MSVRSLLFEGGGREREIEINADTLREIGDERLVWVGIEGDGADERTRIAELVGIDAASIAPSANGRYPVLDRHDSTVELHLLDLQKAEPDAATRPLDVVVGSNWAITASATTPGYLEELEKQLRGDPEVGNLDSPAFLAALLDSHLTGFYRLIDELERHVDEVDRGLLAGRPQRHVLERLARLRASAALVRRALVAHRDLYATLARPDLLPIARSDSAPHFKALMERHERAVDALESVRSQIHGSFEVYMTRVAQRTNDTMKALTILSAVLLPSVALAGIMGMNFRVGFFENPNGFWMVIGAMTILALATIAIGRWRGWL
jgi:Mg2+ and Co2+ transporter CorA